MTITAGNNGRLVEFYAMTASKAIPRQDSRKEARQKSAICGRPTHKNKLKLVDDGAWEETKLD